MHQLLKKFEKKEMASLQRIDSNFNVGDTIQVKIVLSEKKTQNLEGIVIAKKNKGIGSSFTIYHDNISSKFVMSIPSFLQNATVTRIKQGKVRRAKLYYLLNCSRKNARIKMILPKKKEGELKNGQ